MRYCCDGMIQFLMSSDEKTNVNIKESPNIDGGWLLTVVYSDLDIKDPKQFGWGFEGIHYCPFCGKKIKSGQIDE